MLFNFFFLHSQEITEFIESSKNGCVIFAFGLSIPTNELPIKIQQTVFKAFEQLPDYHFIWKFENGTKYPAKNVLSLKLLPQNDLLAHPKVKAFISHGGMSSTQEATWYGVPIIGIPVIVDQHRVR